MSLDIDARLAAQRLAYRHGGRNHATVPAAVVDNHAATRPIHTHTTGAHEIVAVPQNPDDAEPLPRWRHRRPGIDPTDPAWIAAAVVALVVLIALAVTA